MLVFYILLLGLGISMLGFCIYSAGYILYFLIRHLDFAHIARWPLCQQHPQIESCTTYQLP